MRLFTLLLLVLVLCAGLVLPGCSGGLFGGPGSSTDERSAAPQQSVTVAPSVILGKDFRTGDIAPWSDTGSTSEASKTRGDQNATGSAATGPADGQATLTPTGR